LSRAFGGGRPGCRFLGPAGASLIARILLALLLASIVVWPPAPSLARQFDEDVVEIPAPPFTVRTIASLEFAADRVAGDALQAAARVKEALGLDPPEDATIVVLGPDAESGPLSEVAIGLPEWAAGVTLASTNTIVLRLDRMGRYGQREVFSVLTHEMTHLVVAAALPRHGAELPPWFREGLASSVAHEGEWRDLWIVWTSPLLDSPTPFAALDAVTGRGPSEKPLAYAGALAAVEFLRSRYGVSVPAGILAGVRGGADFETAFRDASGVDLATAERAWASDLRMPWIWVVRIGSSYTLWLGITALILLAYLLKRARSRRTMDRWRREEGPDPADAAPEPPLPFRRDDDGDETIH
jgi:hypothetical protein